MAVDLHNRLDALLKERNISRYRLAKNSGVPEETLTNIFNRGSVPTVATLEMICKGLNITMSEFFAENGMVECTPAFQELYEQWKFLTDKQKTLMLELAKELKNKTP